ncbi:MAG TPA: hypothetical protein DEO54_09425 [Rikenellaceae bacterium]|nr:hypothetical protein [Rikenellaceae bacterium]HBZ26434.1 hypothetical protein [Rikenellaceae bacterium]
MIPWWGASKKKKPYAVHKFFCFRLRAKASFALTGNKKPGFSPAFSSLAERGGFEPPIPF